MAKEPNAYGLQLMASEPNKIRHIEKWPLNPKNNTKCCYQGPRIAEEATPLLRFTISARILTRVPILSLSIKWDNVRLKVGSF